MSRSRRAIRVLVLLYVHKMPVEVGDEDGKGRAVCMVLVPGTLDSVGGV